MTATIANPAAAAPGDARAWFRGGYCAPTSGWSNGYAQANLIAVPRDWAYDVLLFCQRNPKPCPVSTLPIPVPPARPWPGDATCEPTCRATGSGATAC